MTPLPALFAFHHIGVGVLDLEAGIDAYRSLGYRPVVAVDDDRLGVRVAFLAPAQAPRHLIEILAPLGPASPLGSLIKRKLLPSPYHTCYAVGHQTEAERALADRDFAQISQPTPALAMDGAPVTFFYHRAIGLLEIVVSPPFGPESGHSAAAEMFSTTDPQRD